MDLFGEAAPPRDIRGVIVHPGLLDHAAQEALVRDVRTLVEAAPLFRPETRRGQKMSVRMTSAGSVGWVSDRRGYRYEPQHPAGVPWPAIPRSVLAIWDEVAGVDRQPDTCLVNFYDADAKMGMHQDRDEADLRWPVVSVSLGDEALFRIGNEERGGRTQSLWLRSGDVAVLGGEGRMLHHGIDRIRAGSSTLLAGGGRLNLTLRVAGA
ncbi:alpha-ketoglutarate-dependent dioxygenase AlkB [Tropicimonas sp. IMCC34011]|uniref:alpha-ketoglutarate-dependent dioxygenase AlkB family protein n=1 Tax=Tropicimonas sp. IMCC34011 TaxID=2248759 RepID=UPI000E222FB1|nr:alpha-ketoglutarate-dependent dioxygenase AlkB [Tropicimonas sp. IMCC34011]